MPVPDLTRREAVTLLASGFALAVQPVTAETITTAAMDLLAGEVRIPTPDGEIPAYRAQPASGGPCPTVLVVQEIFGDPKRLAITGFCWGGRIVWLYAAHNPSLKAGVAWYGRLTSPQERAAAHASARHCGQPQGASPGPLWRRGLWDPE